MSPRRNFRAASKAVRGLAASFAAFSRASASKSVGGDDLVDEARLARFGGGKTFARQQPGAGAGHADATRQQQGGAGLRQQAEIDEGQGEARGLAGVDQVAMQ